MSYVIKRCNKINLAQFKLTLGRTKYIKILKFNKFALTRQVGGFYGKQQLTNCFSETKDMKKLLGVDEVPPAFEQYKGAATKFKSELPIDIKIERITLLQLTSLAENIHFKTREKSQYTDFDIQELLGIDKALQSVQDTYANNTSKLTEIDRRTKKIAQS